MDYLIVIMISYREKNKDVKDMYFECITEYED